MNKYMLNQSSNPTTISQPATLREALKVSEILYKPDPLGEPGEVGLKSFRFPGSRKKPAEKVAGAGRSHGIQDRSEIGEGRMRKISFLRLPPNLTFLFMTLLTEMPQKVFCEPWLQNRA